VNCGMLFCERVWGHVSLNVGLGPAAGPEDGEKIVSHCQKAFQGQHVEVLEVVSLVRRSIDT